MSTNVTVHLAGLLPLSMTVNGSLYNLEPQAGEPARFGIVLRPIGSGPIPLLQKIKQASDVRLRQSDFGLDTVLTNIPNKAQAVGQLLTVPIDINSLDIHLNGIVGGKAFMRNPTSCGTQTTRFTRRLLCESEPEGHRPGLVYVDQLRRAALRAQVHGHGWIGGPHGGRHQAAPQHGDHAEGRRGGAEEYPGPSCPRASAPTSPRWEIRARRPSSDRTRRRAPRIRSSAALGWSRPCCPRSRRAWWSSSRRPVRRAAAAGRGPSRPARAAAPGQFRHHSVRPLPSLHGAPRHPGFPVPPAFQADGLIVASKDLCQSPPPPLGFPVNFVGWNGATQSSTVAATVRGCG